MRLKNSKIERNIVDFYGECLFEGQQSLLYEKLGPDLYDFSISILSRISVNVVLLHRETSKGTIDWTQRSITTLAQQVRNCSP